MNESSFLACKRTICSEHSTGLLWTMPEMRNPTRCKQGQKTTSHSSVRHTTQRPSSRHPLQWEHLYQPATNSRHLHKALQCCVTLECVEQSIRPAQSA